jgi:two-component system, NarL family, response regulator NreC
MSRTRVLLVDDHAVLRDGLRLYLSTQPDIEVVGEAADGYEALVKVEALRPDVALMDVAMPRLNGIEATMRIRRQWPGCRVLVLTQHNRKEYVQRLLQAGASGYVLKKAGGAEVASAIRAVRDGHVYLGAEVADLVIEDYVEHLGRRDEPGQSAYGLLTDREREVLVLVAEGRSTRQIAEVLSVSTKTVDAHRAAIARKVGLHSQADLVKYAIREGLTDMS